MDVILTDRQAAWLARVFGAKSAQRGGTVRRAVHDVEGMVGRAFFVAEVRRRGYSMVENGGQFIVFCNAEPPRRIV